MYSTLFMSFANFHSEFDRDAECGVGQKLEKGDFEIPDNGDLHLSVTAKCGCYSSALVD